MANGEAVFGLFINSGSTIACEVAGLGGFDFVMIDSEHGPTDPLKNRDLIAAAEYRDTAPLVRVPMIPYCGPWMWEPTGSWFLRSTRQSRHRKWQRQPFIHPGEAAAWQRPAPGIMDFSNP